MNTLNYVINTFHLNGSDLIKLLYYIKIIYLITLSNKYIYISTVQSILNYVINTFHLILYYIYYMY